MYSSHIYILQIALLQPNLVSSDFTDFILLCRSWDDEKKYLKDIKNM